MSFKHSKLHLLPRDLAANAVRYLASYESEPPLRGRQQWFFASEVNERCGTRGEQFLLHPSYFDHLRDLPGGIDDLLFSFRTRVISPRYSRMFRFVREHKKEIGAILAVLSGLVGVAKAVFWS